MPVLPLTCSACCCPVLSYGIAFHGPALHLLRYAVLCYAT